MAEIRPLDPNLRQQIAAMLSGDAKAGSVRANLVRGLLGSQTGDDSGLVGMTPLGAAFDVDAANRDRRQGGTGLGHTISAAAGMIPGAGPEARAIEELVVNGARGAKTAGLKVANDAIAHTGMKIKANPEWEEYILQHPDGATYHTDDLQDALGTARAQHMKDNPDLYQQKSVRDQLAAASKDDDKGATVVDAKSPPSVAGTKAAISDATKPTPLKTVKVNPMMMDIKSTGVDHEATKDSGELMGQLARANDAHRSGQDNISLEDLAGGDPKKLNFIRNAMNDEGGNSPEDVAMTLLQHMAEKDPEKFNALHDLVDPEGKDPDLALNHLINNHSIPEMLAIHYDLNPEQMSKAYAIQLSPSRNRPTQ